MQLLVFASYILNKPVLFLSLSVVSAFVPKVYMHTTPGEDLCAAAVFQGDPSFCQFLVSVSDVCSCYFVCSLCFKSDNSVFVFICQEPQPCKYFFFSSCCFLVVSAFSCITVTSCCHHDIPSQSVRLQKSLRPVKLLVLHFVFKEDRMC